MDNLEEIFPLIQGAGSQAALADPYFYRNDPFETKLRALEFELCELAADMLPWQRKCCRLRYEGLSIADIRGKVKKQKMEIGLFLKTPEALLFMRMKDEHSVYTDGPSKSQRAAALWRIVIDNESEDPKEARGAISELNRMDKVDAGGGARELKIIINNVLQKGALDG